MEVRRKVTITAAPRRNAVNGASNTRRINMHTQQPMKEATANNLPVYLKMTGISLVTISRKTPPATPVITPIREAENKGMPEFYAANKPEMENNPKPVASTVFDLLCRNLANRWAMGKYTKAIAIKSTTNR